ncbi:regulatory protein, IclR [Pusillimonas sp. T7-7]|uniref:IclR family transcriptional regulator n=1 Tax=Pusillimonas sp. (strain T7-7) TaxID=1007105 RepID=UPI0002085091|nr:IclR family transcriptional regulator [Pusillimonas sp. T7-7]AEC21250.1 regulatory protein, IclR [Pusillimonas sp. T7-7]
MIVKQVQYAFQILEFFATRRNPATLSEISDHFGWPRSSTFNLIETLSLGGYLYEPKFRAGYYPTRKLFKLAHDTIVDGPISERLRACVVNIAARTDETAALCALSGPQTVFVEVVESSSPIRYFAHIGQRVPTEATSAGRALLSILSRKERGAILRKCDLRRYAPASLMSIDELEEEIEASKARGWAQNINGFEPDLVGLAVPLHLGERQFSLMVAGPSYRVLDRIPELIQILLDEVGHYLRERGEHD